MALRLTAPFHALGMKAPLMLGLLCAAMVFAQNGGPKSKEPKVRTGSRVPGVTVQFTAQDGDDYKFYIHNRSSRGVTAYEVLLVPSGVKRKGNHFLCKSRCAESHEVKTIDQPAIKAGDVVPVTYDAAKVAGGAVVVESAVFDDATYAGNERAAAYLVAQQLGQQEEFDHIVFAVDQVMDGSGPANMDKANRIYSALAGLAIDADQATIVTFERWFPNVRDCAQRFPQVMKSAAAPEVADVESKLQPLLSSNPSEAALAQWWTGTEQFLAQFGCTGCTARLGSPTPPVKRRMISIGCSAQQQPPPQGVAVLAWSVDDFEDDDSADDGSDQAADAGDQDGDDDQLSMTEEPADAASTSAAADAPAKSGAASGSMEASVAPIPAPPSASHSVTTPPRRIPTVPRFYPYPAINEDAAAPGQTAATEKAAPGSFRPVPDEELYEKYFQYVTRWTTYLSQGGTLEAAKNADSPDPFPAKMSGEERNAVTAAAYDYLHAWQEWNRKTRPPATNDPTAAVSTITSVPWDSPAFLGAGAERNRHRGDERLEERDALVKAELDKIKGQTGSTGYRSLGAYVHSIYHARPGRWVREPLPEKMMILYYLRYVAAMDRSAEDSGQGDLAKSAKTRVDEQEAAVLSDQEQAILQQVADDLRQTTKERQAQLIANRPYGIAPASPRSSTTSSGTTRDPRTPGSDGAPVGVPATTSVPATFGAVSPFGQRIAESFVEQLKTKIGDAGFEKIEKRAHTLYGSITTRRVVTVSEAENKTKQAKVSNKP
jgi:hypothetical protein